MLPVPTFSVLHVPYASLLYQQKTRTEPGLWWGLLIQAHPIASSEAEKNGGNGTKKIKKSLASPHTHRHSHLMMTHKAFDEREGVIECKDSIFDKNKDDPEIFMDPIIKGWPLKACKRPSGSKVCTVEHRDWDRSELCLVKRGIWGEKKGFSFVYVLDASSLKWFHIGVGILGGEKRELRFQVCCKLKLSLLCCVLLEESCFSFVFLIFLSLSMFFSFLFSLSYFPTLRLPFEHWVATCGDGVFDSVYCAVKKI